MGAPKDPNSIRSKYEDHIRRLLQDKTLKPSQIADKLCGGDHKLRENLRKITHKIKKDTIKEEYKSNLKTAEIIFDLDAREPQYKDNKKEISEDLSKGEMTLNYDGNGNGKIENLEDLVRHCNIDLDTWEIERYVNNKWDMGYVDSDSGTAKSLPLFQVKVFLKKREESAEVLYERAYKEIGDRLKNRKSKVVSKNGSGIGLVQVADLHIGAFVRGLNKTEDFDPDTVIHQLDRIADNVNSKKYKEVHLSVLGDIIESFTGLNHMNSWKGMIYNGTGADVSILAHEILSDWFKKINNLKTVYMVSGNHDRVTSNKQEDDKGDFTKTCAYFLNREFKNVDVQYDPLCISVEIDNIFHVFTHGHLGFSKKNIGEVFFKYGKQGVFNIISSGHLHTRQKKDPIVMRDFIVADAVDYRGITVPSIFPGNWYSESNGWTSTPGYIIIENNGKNKPNVQDYSL